MVLYELDDFFSKTAINLQIYTVTNDIRWYFSNGMTGLIAVSLLLLLHPIKDLEVIVYIVPFFLVYILIIHFLLKN